MVNIEIRIASNYIHTKRPIIVSYEAWNELPEIQTENAIVFVEDGTCNLDDHAVVIAFVPSEFVHFPFWVKEIELQTETDFDYSECVVIGTKSGQQKRNTFASDQHRALAYNLGAKYIPCKPHLWSWSVRFPPPTDRLKLVEQNNNKQRPPLGKFAKENYIFVIDGPPSSGKSYLCLLLQSVLGSPNRVYESNELPLDEPENVLILELDMDPLLCLLLNQMSIAQRKTDKKYTWADFTEYESKRRLASIKCPRLKYPNRIEVNLPPEFYYRF
jgi:hypothetical protein